MLLRHGHVVAEGWWSPYRPELPHMLFSLSKSFTATAIGLAVSEQLLSLEDKVVSFFPDESPAEPGDNLSQMNISHLLMMGTGHTMDTMTDMLQSHEGNWVRAFLQLPVEEVPGTYFLYNTGATYMLSAILQKVTNQTLLEYLGPRLFTPLGIKDPTWESCPRGINIGGYGLNLTTEDIAKFGQLYLQQGQWNNRQILSREWVAAASSKQIANGDGSPDSGEWSQGYGYQFWNCRHGAFRADGAFCQLCIVMPEQDAVVVITSGTNDTQQVMDAVWELLLPAMKSAPLLQEEPSAVADLAAQLSTLQIEPPRCIQSSSLESSMSAQVYKLEANELDIDTLEVSFSGDEAVLTIQEKSGRQSLVFGREKWTANTANIIPNPSGANAIMASFTWAAEDKLQMTMQLVETPFCITEEITVKEKSIQLTHSFNVTMGPNEPVTLAGYLIE
ncbi:serine hydrolase [Paenibacillus tianjinensis]|uniref:Serine hydrolase n=2 Tax=Paenibacillus tianjinensis TaxID=2810347 RepID=A0ABX7LL71_9BACL|nr:serine hydrolase [Paenibacillus tianjinensis]